MCGPDHSRSFVADAFPDRKQHTMDLNTVASIPLFASVPRRRRWHVARLADEVGVEAGAEVTRQGGYAQEFFVVVSGTADVFRDGERIGGLEPGDFFGEVGLLGHALGAHGDRRRHVADAPARAGPAPVPRAVVRRTQRRGAHPPSRRSPRLATHFHPPRRPTMSQVLDRVRNGVDTAQMYGTLDAIKADPSLGRFQFRVQNHWIDGAHNRSTIQGFYGAGQEDSRARRRSPSTPASRPSCSASTPAPTRPRPCCTPSRRA